MNVQNSNEIHNQNLEEERQTIENSNNLLTQYSPLTNESFSNQKITNSNASNFTGRLSIDDKKIAKKILNYEEIAVSESLSQIVQTPSINFTAASPESPNYQIEGDNGNRRRRGKIIIFDQSKINFVQSGTKLSKKDQNFVVKQHSERMSENVMNMMKSIPSDDHTRNQKNEVKYDFNAMKIKNNPKFYLSENGGRKEKDEPLLIKFKLKDKPKDFLLKIKKKVENEEILKKSEVEDENDQNADNCPLYDIQKNDFKRTSKKNFGTLIIDVEEANKVGIQNLPSNRHKSTKERENYFFGKKDQNLKIKSAKAVQRSKIRESKIFQNTPQNSFQVSGEGQLMIIENAQKVVTQFYENKMERLEEKYEKLLRKNERLANEVMNKDKEIENLKEENKTKFEFLEEEAEKAQELVNEKNEEISRLKRKCEKFEHELEIEKMKNVEIATSVRTQQELGVGNKWKHDNEIKRLEKEILKLKEENELLFKNNENFRKYTNKPTIRSQKRSQNVSIDNSGEGSISKYQSHQSNPRVYIKDRWQNYSKKKDQINRIIDIHSPSLRLNRRKTDDPNQLKKRKKKAQNFRKRKDISYNFHGFEAYSKPVVKGKQRSLDISDSQDIINHLENKNQLAAHEIRVNKGNIDNKTKQSMTSKEDEICDNLTSGNLNLSSFLANLRRSFEESNTKTIESHSKNYHKKTSSLSNNAFSIPEQEKQQLGIETNFEMRLNATCDTKQLKDLKSYVPESRGKKKTYWSKNTPTYSKYRLNIDNNTGMRNHAQKYEDKKRSSQKFIDIINSTNRTKKRDFRRRKRRTLECLLKEEKTYTSMMDKHKKDFYKNKTGADLKYEKRNFKKMKFGERKKVNYPLDGKIGSRIKHKDSSHYESMKRLRYYE